MLRTWNVSLPLWPSILKEINLEYSFGRVDADVELQYCGHLMWRADSLEKTLTLGRIEGRRRGCQRMRLLDGITDSTDMTLSKLWKTVEDRETWHTAVHGVTKSRTQLSDWTTKMTFNRHLGIPPSGQKRHVSNLKVKVKSFSRVQLFATPWTVAYQAPPSMGFPRQEYLEWVAISFSRGSSQPRDRTQVSRIGGRRFILMKWWPILLNMTNVSSFTNFIYNFTVSYK